jgi:hypothetical protein
MFTGEQEWTQGSPRIPDACETDRFRRGWTLGKKPEPLMTSSACPRFLLPTSDFLLSNLPTFTD